MKYPVTKRQQDVLIALERMIAANGGLSPSHRELGAELGITHKAVSQLIKRLTARGHVRQLPHAVRTLQIVSDTEKAA